MTISKSITGHVKIRNMPFKLLTTVALALNSL